MEEEYLSKLEAVGLSGKEARAYLALLALGRGSAASVAEKSGLKTPTAYVILKSLMEKGFARRIPRAKKQLFAPETPALALAAAESRIQDFRSIVPSLDALAKSQGKTKTRTLFFEGIPGMRKAYAYQINELRSIEYVAFFASAENISTELNKILLEWNTAMAKANVTSRAIVPDHVTLEEWRKKDSEHKREVRIVPNHLYSAKSAIEVFPDFVRIVMFGDLQCTIIEDKEFATACRQIFEIAWSAVPSNT